METQKTIKLYALLAVSAIFMLIMVFKSFTVVSTGHVGVITTFGKVEGHFPEGFHFKKPISKVYELDCRADRLKLENITFPSQDQLTSNADIYVQWRIDATKASQIYAEIGDRESVVTKILEPSCRSFIRQTSKTVLQAEEFFKNEVQERIQNEMSESLKTKLLPQGIIIDEVLVSDVLPPEVIVKGIQAKKLREQKAQEQEAELVRFTTEQKQQVEKARAEKEASELDAEKTKIAADAKAYAFRTEAEAKAKALEIEGQSIRANPDVIKMRAVEGWDGKLPTFFGGDPALFLPIPSLTNN